MIHPTWQVEDAESGSAAAGIPQDSLVSLHFLRTALHRQARLVVAFALEGVLLAAAMLWLVPAGSTSTATLLLAHDPSTDSLSAMGTDVSLLETRTVAQRVIDRLDLDLSVDDLQASMTVEQVTSQILSLSLTAPDNGASLRRVDALTDEFLTFRGTQIQAQADAVIDGDRTRIETLQKQTESITTRYDDLVSAGANNSQQASDLLSDRSRLNDQIANLQQEIQDTSLQSGSIVAASHVVDPAAVVPPHRLKRTVLVLASGLIGGLAVGVGLVLATALLSSRLRRREEVALALGLPVRFSAGRVRARVGTGAKARRNLAVLATGLESALGSERARAQVALATADDPGDAAAVVAALAGRLAERGEQVFLVDLTSTGALERRAARKLGSAVPVFRPGEESRQAKGRISLVSAVTDRPPDGDPRRDLWEGADVVLVLGEVELGAGTGRLDTWADRAVLLVTAGKSSAERLRSLARLFATTGPEVGFAMVVRADELDDSSGTPVGLEDGEPLAREGS